MSWAWSRAPPAPPLPAALPEVSSVTAAGPLVPEAHTPALPSLLDEPISFEQVIALAAKSRLTPLPVPRRSSELLSPSVPVVGPSLGARPPAAEGPATGPSGAKQREAHPSLGLEDVDVAWALDVNEGALIVFCLPCITRATNVAGPLTSCSGPSSGRTELIDIDTCAKWPPPFGRGELVTRCRVLCNAAPVEGTSADQAAHEVDQGRPLRPSRDV